MSTQATAKVTKGMQFRSVIADSNSLWETIRPSGRSAWIAVCVDEPYKMPDGRTIPSDFAGTEKAFLNTDILDAVAWSKTWSSLGDENARWWDAQEIGTVIHYCDGFNIFYRGYVDYGVDSYGRGPIKGIRVTALVGPDFQPCLEDGDGEPIPNTFVQGIRSYELPHIDAAGRVDMGRYADRIGDFWQPSHTCVYEHPTCSYRDRGIDPRPLPDRDLTPPVPDVEAERMAALDDLRRWVCARTTETPRQGTTWDEVARSLRDVARMINSQLDLDTDNGPV